MANYGNNELFITNNKNNLNMLYIYHIAYLHNNSKMDYLKPMNDQYTVYTRTGCSYCKMVMELLKREDPQVDEICCDEYIAHSKPKFFQFIDIMDREHFVLDRFVTWKPDTYGIYNALIIAKPGNPIFLDCIKQIVKNPQTNFYGFNPLYPTGPGLLGEVYFGNINNNIDMLDKFDLVHNIIDSISYVIYKNQLILQEYPEYRTEQWANQKQRHYNELWKQRAIYTSPSIN